MKNVIAAIILSSVAVMAYAEQTFNVTCGYAGDVCNLETPAGMVEVDQKDLPKYIPAGDPSKHDCQGLFCTNDSFAKVGLNPAEFPDAKQAPASQPTQQQAAEIPYKILFAEGNPMGTYPQDRSAKLVLLSTTNSLVVEKIVINEGRCIGWDNGLRGSQRASNLGSKINVPLYACTPVKVDITTSMGSWTHTFN